MNGRLASNMRISRTSDVAIVGGGIVGLSTSYFLNKNGLSTVVIDPDPVGQHASGLAYGGLSALVGPGPTQYLAQEGMRIHREFSESLPVQTGTNTEFRYRPSLTLVLSELDVMSSKNAMIWNNAQDGYRVEWVEPENISSIEPRITSSTFGALYTEGQADLEPYRSVLSLAQATQQNGTVSVRDRVTGLKFHNNNLIHVLTKSGPIAAKHVVLAMGPWANHASPWVGWNIPISPLKGQILRLRSPGAPLKCAVSWNGFYAVTKPDGLVWTGTTEENVGFDKSPTLEGRTYLTNALLEIMPSMEGSEVVRQTACLRPIAPDRQPLLGKIPGFDHIYVATGGDRSGILMGPAMGRVISDMITRGSSDIEISGLNADRFNSGCLN